MPQESRKIYRWTTLLEASRRLWMKLRPLSWIAAAGLLGLILSTLLAMLIHPMMLGTIHLVTNIGHRVAYIVSWLAAHLHQQAPPYPELPGNANEDIPGLDLSFGVLGGSILVTTIRESISQLAKVVAVWATASHETLVSASAAILLSFFGLGISVFGINKLNLHGEDLTLSYDSAVIPPVAVDPEHGAMTFFVSFGKEGGLDTIRDPTSTSVVLGDRDAIFLRDLGNALRACHNLKSASLPKVLLRGFASSTPWRDAKMELETLERDPDPVTAGKAAAVLNELRRIVQATKEAGIQPDASLDEQRQYWKAFNVYLANTRAAAVKVALDGSAGTSGATTQRDMDVEVQTRSYDRDIEQDLAIADRGMVTVGKDRGILTRTAAVTIANAGDCSKNGITAALKINLHR